MTELDNLIKQYGETDMQEKELKKSLESQKTVLKEIFSKEGLSKYSAEGFTVSCIESERESFDQDKAVNILKSTYPGECPYIKTVEVVDMDALESAIYNEQIDRDLLIELNTCRNVTKVVTLKCSKTKKET